jgi:hypothetical protein
MASIYTELEDRERRRLSEHIINNMSSMQLHELELLSSISSNIDIFRQFLKGLKFFSGIKGI